MKHLLALIALSVSPVAQAQTFSSPPDVGTYSPRAATYAAGTTLNVIGDGSNAKGGIAPAFTTHPEPFEDESLLDPAWIIPGPTDACVSGSTTDCQEKKWRTQVESSHFGFDDPIRFWGKSGTSHCHEFFGNRSVNAFTTRASLRARPGSNAAGGTWQSTGYWEPCWLKTIGGKTYAIPATGNTVYYEEAARVGQPIIDDLQPLHLLLRFIGGKNVDDYDDTVTKAEIAAANAQPGTAGRYEYRGTGNNGYGCQLTNGTIATTKAGAGSDLFHSSGFLMADGSDPWEGRCVAGSFIYAENNAPRCWDGWNVSSPDGYRHFRNEVQDNVADKSVCPNGWYKVPVFQVKSFHQTSGGYSEYRYWFLSSTAMTSAKLGRTIIAGEDAHFDWMNGQAKKLISRWLSYCMGIVPVGQTSVPHQCNYSVIDATGRLLSDSPAPDGSRNPQINLNRQVNSDDPAQLHLVDPTRAAHVNMKGM